MIRIMAAHEPLIYDTQYTVDNRAAVHGAMHNTCNIMKEEDKQYPGSECPRHVLNVPSVSSSHYPPIKIAARSRPMATRSLKVMDEVHCMTEFAKRKPLIIFVSIPKPFDEVLGLSTDLLFVENGFNLIFFFIVKKNWQGSWWNIMLG